MEKKSNSVNQSLALALGEYKHKKTKTILLKLLKSDDDFTREFAAVSLLKLYGQQALIEINDKKIDIVI